MLAILWEKSWVGVRGKESGLELDWGQELSLVLW